MKKTYDHEKMLKMYDAGYTAEKIAKKMGCKTDTVNKVLKNNGRIDYRRYGRYLMPICQREVEQYRKRLRIGEKKIIEVQVYDKNFCLRMRKESCVIEEKYDHIFVARNSKGQIRTMRYIDMIISERKEKEGGRECVHRYRAEG